MAESVTAAGSAPAGITEHGPWNPGLQSEVPWPLLPLATLFRPENVFTSLDEVHELADVTGVPPDELAVFRPERLLVHELLIRVTADFSVPDGPRVEDLGINFRQLADTLLERHLKPRLGEIVAAYDAVRAAAANLIAAELGTALAALARGAAAAPAREQRTGGLLARLRARQRGPATSGDDDRWSQEERIVRDWSAKAHAGDPLNRAAYRALVRVASAVRARHGRIWGDAELLGPVATGIACNDRGAEVIGELIEPHLAAAADREGCRLLPARAQPVVMNTKGAPASGKSTMRPLQRALAAALGVDWADFALVSPDIWRKFLLDYGALGGHYKYAGAFTARELAIVDHKLDRYMARKAERGGMPHLLIDRFRFDSFAPDSDEAGSNLLTRFGRLVYLFFMITPPHATVERAWRRGLEVGRYKSVDDVLAQNIEAYAGMPELFFTWAARPGMSVHYEFIDNDVPYGARPRTAAFGRAGELNVLDVRRLLDVERYRRIKIEAASPREVYPDPHAMAAAANTRFLVRCARELRAVNFADRASGRVYARIEAGRLAWTEPEALGRALEDAETRAGLAAVAAEALSGAHAVSGPRRLAELAPADGPYTLGEWGTAAA